MAGSRSLIPTRTSGESLEAWVAALPVVFASDTRVTADVTRAAAKGLVRKIAPRVYSTNVTDPIEDVTRRNALTIASLTARAELELELDIDSVINESYNFLKSREPEMTRSEYALYEKVVPMVFEQPEFALTLLETMIADEEEESAAFHYILANVYFTSDRMDDAEREYRAAVDKYPEFLRAWNNLGFFYYSQERFSDAIPCLSKSIELGDSEARTLGVLGYCLREEGNLVAAEMLYMQAVAVDPNNSDWTEGLLAIALDTEQFPRAEAYVRQFLMQKPDAREKWMLLASLLVKQNRNVEAAAILETASSLGYADTDGLLLLGDLCAGLRLNDEAVAAYSKAIPMAGDQGVDRAVAFSRLLIDAGDLEKAESLLGTLMEPSGVSERVLLHHARADLHTAREEWPEARAELEELTRLDPLHGVALLQLGKLLHKAGEPVRAMFAYEAAAQDDSTAYHANLALGNLAMEANDYKAAIDRLETALNLTSTPEIREILAHVRHLADEDET